MFVFEMNRHGARSHYMESPNMPEGYFGEGVKAGYLTKIGRMQHLRIGLERREEYVKGKKLLSEEYNPEEILVMATFKQRCAVSGLYYLHGLYPAQDIRFDREVLYQGQENSPLMGTTYTTMLDSMGA
jgi:hypothetical protein